MLTEQNYGQRWLKNLRLKQHCEKLAEIGEYLPAEEFCDLLTEEIENELLMLDDVGLDGTYRIDRRKM